jgi:hypothetical protein
MKSNRRLWLVTCTGKCFTVRGTCKERQYLLSRFTLKLYRYRTNKMLSFYAELWIFVRIRIRLYKLSGSPIANSRIWPQKIRIRLDLDSQPCNRYRYNVIKLLKHCFYHITWPSAVWFKMQNFWIRKIFSDYDPTFFRIRIRIWIRILRLIL